MHQKQATVGNQALSEKPRLWKSYARLSWLLILSPVLWLDAVPPMIMPASAAEDGTVNSGNATESKDPTIGKVTPLHKAVKSGRLEDVRVLLDQGADVNAAIARRSVRWHRLETPLETSMRNENVEIAKLLIERGANVNARNTKGETLLHLAVRLNNVELVKLLLAGGAHPTIRSRDGLGPVHLAQKLDRNSGKRKEIIALLKQAEAKALQEDPPIVPLAPPPGPLE